MSSDGKHPKQIATQFKPGQSGNPGGSVVGHRKWLNAEFLRALTNDFKAHGAAAIERCREEELPTYIKALVALQPKEVEHKHPLGDMTDEEIQSGIDALRRIIAAEGTAGGAGEPPQSAQTH